MTDPRITHIINALGEIRQGKRILPPALEGEDDLSLLGKDLSVSLEQLFNELDRQQVLFQVIEKVNLGLTLVEVLNYAYDALKPLIPFDRMGFSLITPDGKSATAIWARSEVGQASLTAGYTAALAGSSLERIVATGEPRILNDLEKYLREKPRSESTRLIIADGMRSNLTCPLVAMTKPIGFMFFSSCKINAYNQGHVEVFSRIAQPFALIAEKGRLYQRVLELNDEKNKFLGMAAHDLRTPIAVMKGHLDLLADRLLGDINEEQEGSIKTMTALCGRMLSLIEEFLDISTIESGKLTLKKESVDLQEYLKMNAEFIRPFALRKKIELRLDLPSGSAPVLLDAARISQVINNLVSNALKFSLPHTVVTLRAVLTEQDVQIAVEDQGPGIAPEDLSRIFSYFGKTRNRPTGGEASTGLGLAIVKKIVEAHGGKIWVENHPGQGAVFLFSLPRG